ncbi:MAG: flavin reductase family protein [Thermoleophilia bacterium]
MKTNLGPRNCLYPMPTTLVGATVNGKPNFITIAHVGIATPGSITLGMGRTHYSNAGIREHGVFSVNIPSEDLLEKTDCCGLVSGREIDKASLFSIFYGELDRAPLIEECPINMECRLVKTVEFPTHDLFIGEIVATHCDDEVLEDGVVDFARVRPLLFVMNDRSYWRLGDRFSQAWSAGMELRKRLKASD